MGLADELAVADLACRNNPRSNLDQLLDVLEEQDASALRSALANRQYTGANISRFLKNFGKKTLEECKGKPKAEQAKVIDLCSRITPTNVQRYRQRSGS